MHLAILSAHYYLMADTLRRVRHSESRLTRLQSFREYRKLRQAQFCFTMCRFTPSHWYFLYRHFHSHLPEDLFFEDFKRTLMQNNYKTFKTYQGAF